MVRRAPSTRLLYQLKCIPGIGTGLTKGVENYIDLISSSLGLGGRLFRKTTFPRLFRSHQLEPSESFCF